MLDVVSASLDEGFNEAGAVMPRKGRLDQIRHNRRMRFNEAGAVMPRKGSQRNPATRDA